MGSYEYNKRWRAENPEKHREARRRQRQSPNEKARRREAKQRRAARDPLFYRNKALKKKYGIKHNDYERMLEEQGGVCAICGTDTPGGPTGKLGPMFRIDHCHNSGTIRKLLCDKCNVGLGSFRENPSLLQKAADYLLDYAA